MTDKKAEVNEAGRTQDKMQEVALKSAEAAHGSVAVGDHVTILTNTPEGHPVSGVVRVVQEEAGKRVGVELDEYSVYGHSLDGLVDEREQGGDQPVIGKGWWATEENVQKLNK